MNQLLIAGSIVPLDAREYLENSLSENTRQAYRCDLAHYAAWGGAIPATPETITAYLAAHAASLSMATLQRRLASLSKAHTIRGYSDPVKAELVRMTFRGIRRIHGKPQQQVAPILKDDLILMLSRTPDSIKGKRDRALLMLGFCAALRRSELVQVQHSDIEFTSQGIVLTLPRSKTDQQGQGRRIGIPFARGRTCPVVVIKEWFLHSGANTGPIFRSVTKGGIVRTESLSTRAVADIVKHYAQMAGLDSGQYSGHSLRAGLATSAAQQGISSWVIRKQTGHASDMMLNRYIRTGDLFTNNAAALF